MKVLLFDDGKIPNLAIMKLSAFFKSQNCEVVLDDFFKPSGQKADLVFCSVVFSRNKKKALTLKHFYPQMQIGGTGWDDYLANPPVISRLPHMIEVCKPDYDLYTTEYLVPRIKGIMTKETRRKKAQELVNAGFGFSTRGCIRRSDCGFCVVPKKEGRLRQESEIADIINPRSNVIVLMDNNLTADPNCLGKLREIKERGLVVDISSGIDVRLMTPEKAKALSEVKMLRSLHYSWDLMQFEQQVFRGIEILSTRIKKWRHMCFMIVCYNTTFEEDMYRFRKLTEAKIDPYVLIYNQKPDLQLNCFARWVNSRIYKTASWEDYEPWIKAQQEMEYALAM